jgi:hypothetical protein
MCLLGGLLGGWQRGCKTVSLGSKAGKPAELIHIGQVKLAAGCLEKVACADAQANVNNPFYREHFKMVVSLGEAKTIDPCLP